MKSDIRCKKFTLTATERGMGERTPGFTTMAELSSLFFSWVPNSIEVPDFLLTPVTSTTGFSRPLLKTCCPI